MKSLKLLFALLLPALGVHAQGYWKKVSTPLHQDLLAISFATKDTGFACGTDSTLIRTTDAGKTWSRLNPSGLPYSSSTRDLTAIQFVGPRKGWIVLGNRNTPGVNGQLYQTNDGGLSWTFVAGAAHSVVKCFFFDDSTGYSIGVSPFGGPSLFRLDRGMWSSVHYLGTSTGNMASAIDFYNASTGIIGSDMGYVYRTFDGGLHWDTVKTNVEDTICALRYLNEHTIVAGTSNDFSLLISKDKGATWSLEPASMTFFYPVMKAMVVSRRDSLVAVGRSRTTGKGLIYHFGGPVPGMDIAQTTNRLNGAALRNDTATYIVGDSGLILTNEISGATIVTASGGADKVTVIYPNPAGDLLYIRSCRLVKTICVVDCAGREVLRRPFTEMLDVSHLLPGTYLLKLVDDSGQSSTHTWMKQ